MIAIDLRFPYMVIMIQKLFNFTSWSSANVNFESTKNIVSVYRISYNAGIYIAIIWADKSQLSYKINVNVCKRRGRITDFEVLKIG